VSRQFCTAAWAEFLGRTRISKASLHFKQSGPARKWRSKAEGHCRPKRKPAWPNLPANHLPFRKKIPNLNLKFQIENPNQSRPPPTNARQTSLNCLERIVQFAVIRRLVWLSCGFGSGCWKFYLTRCVWPAGPSAFVSALPASTSGRGFFSNVKAFSTSRAHRQRIRHRPRHSPSGVLAIVVPPLRHPKLAVSQTTVPHSRDKAQSWSKTEPLQPHRRGFEKNIKVKITNAADTNASRCRPQPTLPNVIEQIPPSLRRRPKPPGV